MRWSLETHTYRPNTTPPYALSHFYLLERKFQLFILHRSYTNCRGGGVFARVRSPFSHHVRQSFGQFIWILGPSYISYKNRHSIIFTFRWSLPIAWRYGAPNTLPATLKTHKCSCPSHIFCNHLRKRTQHSWLNPSSQAKGTSSTPFLTCVRNEVELVPLACEDVHVRKERSGASTLGLRSWVESNCLTISNVQNQLPRDLHMIFTHSMDVCCEQQFDNHCQGHNFDSNCLTEFCPYSYSGLVLVYWAHFILFVVLRL